MAARRFLLSEMENPQRLAQLAWAEVAREVYLASLAVEVDSDAEENDRRRLAARLGLETDAVTEIDAPLEADDEAA